MATAGLRDSLTLLHLRCFDGLRSSQAGHGWLDVCGRRVRGAGAALRPVPALAAAPPRAPVALALQRLHHVSHLDTLPNRECMEKTVNNTR